MLRLAYFKKGSEWAVLGRFLPFSQRSYRAERRFRLCFPQFGSYSGHLLFLEDTQESFYPAILPRASIGTFIAEKFMWQL
jgi:hypothetical protein